MTYAQYRTPEEKDRDQRFDEHLLNHMGDDDECEWCRESGPNSDSNGD